MSATRLTTWFVVLCLTSAAGGQTLSGFLSRISEEADVFGSIAPQIIAEETLTQRALKAPPRIHPRIGKAATKPPEVAQQTREIVSEYSFGAFKDTPHAVHEFRQVTSIDGRRVSATAAARQALIEALSSDGDRNRRRMLDRFQKLGLASAAVDFGQIILLFTRREIPNYRFALGAKLRIGAEVVQIIDYRQISGADRTFVVQDRHPIHQPTEGRIYVRVPDGLPLRVTFRSVREEGHHTFRDEATVDYVQTPHGFLAPASVLHHGYGDDQELVEDRFTYTAFRKFGADAEIKFDALPDDPKK